MDKNCYTYHELSNDDTYNPTVTGIKVELKPLNDIYKLRGTNDFPFSKVLIPQRVYSLLEELLNHYDLSDKKDDFISLLVYCQYHYISARQEVFDPNSMSGDFIFERKDLEQLMVALEDYLFASDLNYLHSINFKFGGKELKPTITINNFFIIDDIYRSIICAFGLTKENFEKRKAEILSSMNIENTKSIKNPAEWFKKQVIITIHQYLSDRDFIQSESLRFIGAFLTLCQIKSNNSKKVSFDFYSNLTNLIEGTDIKNLRNYITR